MENNYELVDWAKLKEECYYDHDNDGFIFGVHYLDDNGNIVDTEWFKTELERQQVINGLTHK